MTTKHHHQHAERNQPIMPRRRVRLLGKHLTTCVLAAGMSFAMSPKASAVLWNATDSSYSAVNASGLTDNYGQFTNASYIYNGTASTRGTATYLKNGWFLTARHVVQNGGDYGQVAPAGQIQINIYGQNYYGDQIVEFGSADVALVHVGGYTSGQLTTLTGVEKRQVAGPGNGLAQIGGFGLWGPFGSSPSSSVSFHRAFNTPWVSGAFLNLNANQNSRLINDGYVLGVQQGGDSGSAMWEANMPTDQSLDLYDWSLTGVCQTGGGTTLGGASGAYGFLQSYASTIHNTVYPHAVLTWNANPGAGTTAVDGSGTWDLTSTNFTDGTNYAFNGPERTEQVIFGSGNGTAGTVTLGATIPVTDIIFDSNVSGSYTIAGSAGRSLSVRPHSRITTNADATISADITGGSPGSLRGFGDSMFSTPKLIKNGSATLTLTGTTTLDSGAAFHARQGTTVIDSDGELNSGNHISVGVYQNESVVMILRGNAEVNGANQDFNVADLGGTGELHIEDNAALNVGQLYVGKGWTRTTNNGTQPLSAGGTGTVVQSGGVVTASSFVAIGSSNTASAGTYNLSGGELHTGAVQGGMGNSTFHFDGGTLTATTSAAKFMQGLTQTTIKSGGAVVDTNGFDITIAQALLNGGGNGGLTKNGAGTLIIKGANTYTGPTDVLAGTLVVDGSTGSGLTTVGGGATLGGGGEVKSNLIAMTGSQLRIGAAGLPIDEPSLIDNFDSYNNDRTQYIGAHSNGDVTGGVWDGVFDGTGNAQILDNSTAGDNSLGVFGDPAQGTAGWRGGVTDLVNNFANDYSLANGDTATYFFQVMNEGNAYADTMMGLTSDLSALDVNDAYADYAVMPYVSGSPGAASFGVYGDNRSGGIVAALTDGQWQNVWLVVDNANKVFDVYTSTGTDDGALALSGVQFGRLTDPVNLGAFGITGRDDGRVRIDNLYKLDGVDTDNPLASGSGTAYLPEVLTVDGDVVLNSGVTVTFDIATTGINDMLSVAGNLTAAGTLEVILDGSAPALGLGDSFDLFDFTSVSGAFDDYLLPVLGSGLDWDTSAVLTTGVLQIVSSLLDGDLNGDGFVGLDDLDIVLSNWNQSVTAGDSSQGDPSGDGFVGLDDLDVVLSNWNAGAPPSESSNIPEPMSLVLFAIGGVALMKRCDTR